MMGKQMKNKYHLIPNLSLNRPISAVMILIALLIVGFIAYTRIPAKMMPDGFTPPFLYVWLPYSNASAKEVEEQITKPVEEILGTVHNIKRISANSRQRGSGILLEFESGTDMSLAYNQVVDRLDRVKPELPDDQRFRYIWKWSPSNEPIMWVAIAIREGYTVEDPYDLLDRYIKRSLERVDGVAKVELWGARQKSIYIKLIQDRIQSLNINIYQLWQTLQSANFTLSGGHINEGDRKLLISSVAKFRSLDEIRNLTIKGTTIRVKDIADVEYDFSEKRRINRVNRLDGMSIGVFHEEQASAIELSERLKTAINTVFENTPELAPLEHYILFTAGDVMSSTIDEFKMTALYGGFFALLVLFFFLRKIKMTMIITLALPMSLMVMMTILYFMGWSLNLLTMMGLILSVGMVVDNSIVVSENIFRIRQTGVSRKEASLQGASEVGLAITMSTFTTLVVFLPLIIMGGDEVWAFFMGQLGVPVMLAIVASLLIALYFIPLGTAVFHEPEKSGGFFLTHWFDKVYKGSIGRLNLSYTKALKTILTHRSVFIFAFMMLFFTMFPIIGMIPTSGDLEGNINDFRLIIETPANYTLQETNNVYARIEKLVWENREKYSIKTLYSRFHSRRGQLRVFLEDPPKRFMLGRFISWLGSLFSSNDNGMMTREEVIEDLKENIPNFPGVNIRWGWSDQGGDDSSININIFGKDLKQLEIYSEEIKQRLKSIEGVLSVETDYEERGADEIQLRVDRRMAKNLDIDPRTIAGTVSYSLRGNLLSRFQFMDREIDVYLQLRKEDRKTLDQLKNITVTSRTGKRYPLSTVVKPYVERGPTELRRQNRKTMLRIKLTSMRDDKSELFGAIRERMDKINFRRGYTWSLGQRFQQLEETQAGMGQIMLLVVTFVFFLMGVLFESFILPLSVLAAVPFAFWGAFWLLFITGTTMDPMAYIGMTILIGVVVNNAIVLIDLVNRLRKEGKSRTDAIIEAGTQRFRPILMTALTTICGLLPMTIGSSATAGISYAPLGRAFTGGLLASTISTLFLVPLFYTYMDDLREKVGRGIMSSIFFRKKTATN